MSYTETGNAVLDKSFYFACDIVLFSKRLKENQNFEIAGQILRSGTSIGANVRESQRGVSTKDFKHKLGIALKEADETMFWLDVIEQTGVYEVPVKLRKDCEVLIRLLVAIMKKS